MDNINVSGSALVPLEKIITNMATLFFTKDLGHHSYFLGVEIIPTIVGLFLSQKKYIYIYP